MYYDVSAISLTNTQATPAKKLDRMWQVSYFPRFASLHPYLKKTANPHILALSPPLNMDAKWFAPHLAYSISKYGMGLCAPGMARELATDGIAVNYLGRAPSSPPPNSRF